MIEIPQLLTIAEVADILKVPEATIRDWRTDRRNLPFIKMEGEGGGVRVDPRDLELYIAKHKQYPVAKTVVTADDAEVRDDQPKRAKILEFPA